MKTVTEIMQRDVATVTPDTTVRDLARFLADRSISGAPVVSEAGALVGVVSATDIVRRAADDGALAFGGEGNAGATEAAAMYYMPEESDWTVMEWTSLDLDEFRDEMTVEDIMTPVTFGVSPGTTLREAAEFMVRGRIHRALVLDGSRLLGLVSAMDLLRAFAEGGSTAG